MKNKLKNTKILISIFLIVFFMINLYILYYPCPLFADKRFIEATIKNLSFYSENGQNPATNQFVTNCKATTIIRHNSLKSHSSQMDISRVNAMFNSVALMRLDTSLKTGMTARTSGYYSANDGGGGIYTIRAITNEDIEDGGSIIFLNNGNVAELIVFDGINVNQFGAKGDGVTDDTEKIDAAIQFGVSHGCIVRLLEGTYIVGSREILVEIGNGQNFVLEGSGKKSILKRKDRTITADGQRAFWIHPKTSNTVDVESVKISNLFINSNAANNTSPKSGYAHEHCADFRINGKPNSYIKTVAIDNVSCTDGIADHFLFAGTSSAFVRAVKVSNFLVDYRNRKRSDLCFTGWVNRIEVVNSKMVVFETEYNTVANPFTNLYMRNVELDRLDVTGGIVFNVKDIKTKVGTYIGASSGTIENSVFHIRKNDRFRSSKGLLFQGCTFTQDVDENNRVISVLLQAHTEIEFNNCSFASNKDTFLIRGYVLQLESNSGNNKVKISNCRFADNIEYALINDRRSGETVIENCTINNPNGIKLIGAREHPINILLRNVIFNSNTIFLQLNASTLTLDNVTHDINKCMILRGDSSWLSNASINGFRTIYVDDPPVNSLAAEYNLMGGYFKGDTIVNRQSQGNMKNKWIMTKSSFATEWNHFFDNCEIVEQ